MIYFSELKGEKVFTEDNLYVGRLTDLVFRSSDNPVVTKLAVKTKSGGTFLIGIQFLKKFRGDFGDIIVRKHYEIAEITSNELYLKKNLLDNQIIDISGSKIVRVNDIAIQDRVAEEIYVAGVDIGLIGLLRWFGLERIVNQTLGKVGIKLNSTFLSWADIQALELTRGHVQIKTDQAKLSAIKAEDLADYLEETNVVNIKEVLNVLDEKKAADVINKLSLNYQRELFKQFSSEEAAKLIDLMDPEESADILSTLPTKKSHKILSLLHEKMRHEIEYLLKMSQTPVGDVLSTEYLTVTSNLTAQEVMAKIRLESSDFRSFAYVYVVNDQNQLVGVFDLHELILQRPDRQVFKFMTQNVSVIYLTTPPAVVLRKLIKYTLFALPVIDDERHVLGIVIFDDVSEYIGKI
jgi:CBS domain-containing protein/sporulation protein YlmC with PRC-barrel domain